MCWSGSCWPRPAGLADATFRGDVGHLEQVRVWLGESLWDTEAADADSYFGKVVRDAAKGTPQARTQALTTYFQFLELRPTSMHPSPALPLRQPAWCSPYPAVHAARVGAILGVRLDDIDLGNHQLTIVGRVRPLDDSPAAYSWPGWTSEQSLAEHRQSAPAHQPAGCPGNRSSQPPLGQPDAARPYRDFRAAARRPPTRRSTGPPSRPDAPRGRLRPRREDRAPLRLDGPATAGNPD